MVSPVAKGDYQNFSYAYLHEGARFAVEQGEAKEQGQFYNVLTAMLLSALCAEAYLNHLGPLVLEYWDDRVKQGMSTESKVKVLCSVLPMQPGEADRVIGTVRELMSFRNKVAHAKTETGSFEASFNRDGSVTSPDLSWAGECTLGKSKQFLRSVERQMDTLHERANQPPPAYGIMGEGSYTG